MERDFLAYFESMTVTEEASSSELFNLLYSLVSRGRSQKPDVYLLQQSFIGEKKNVIPFFLHGIVLWFLFLNSTPKKQALSGC